MSKTVSNILYHTVRTAVAPLSVRQREKTLSRLGETLEHAGRRSVQTAHGPLHFLAGRSAGIASAVAKFHEDEPETLHWIDQVIQPGETLWDIGANVGLYSLYAGKRGANVYAFEPNAGNHALLAEHVVMNNLSARVKPVCLAFADSDGLTDLQMVELTVGSASSFVGDNTHQHGEVQVLATQSVMMMRADSFAERFTGSAPDHIKLDVDGTEASILRGAPDILGKVKSLLIEIEGNNARDQEITGLIEAAGLRKDMAFKERSAHGRNWLFARG